uniref:J domain-containing protein n=1 Tax=Brassica campestris TaxID=3711 RepID=M4DHW0_BRACM
MFCGLNEAVQANESEAISISDEDHGNPISSVYSENNCVRGRAGGRGRNHRRGRGRGRGRGRDNHDLGGPSRNSSDNRSLRQRCPVLGSQVNNDVVEVVNLESYTDEDDLSHYTVLGLTPFASQAEVKRAFKRLALKYHPDVQKGQEKDFKEIISAYECLMQKFESQEEEEVEEITELDATDEWEEWMGFEGGIPSSVYTSF